VRLDSDLTRCLMKMLHHLLVLIEKVWPTATDRVGIVAISKAIPVHLEAQVGLRQTAQLTTQCSSARTGSETSEPVSLRRNPLATYSRTAKDGGINALTKSKGPRSKGYFVELVMEQGVSRG
jgi:hypothetical protein